MKEDAPKELTLEERCAELREDVKQVGFRVAFLHTDDMFAEGDQSLSGGNVPASRNANARANITIAFRHLEDARMRLGKVMQAIQGGTSILDKA